MWTTWANTDAVGHVKHDGRAVWHATIASQKARVYSCRETPVWLNNSAESCRIAIVIVQEPTQAFATPDLTDLAPQVWLGCNQLVGEALMVALGMIVGQILVERIRQR
jgi:hypothetical protein